MKMIKKSRLAVLLTSAVLGTALLAGCGSSDGPTATLQNNADATPAASEAAPVETAPSETMPTKAETMPTESEAATDTSTEDETAEANQVILVVSFGTSYNESRDLTIGAIENAIADEFPEYEVRRAFTSQIIIDKLAERDGLVIDNVEEALDRAVADGVTTLVVQPTHLMNGYEYTDLADALEDYEAQFETVVLAEPLLTSDADFEAVADAITSRTADYDDGETAICFMGHGTEADSNVVYPQLQDILTENGYDNYFIGTVEAEPSLDDVLTTVGENDDYSKVVLMPLMVVSGDHATNDMAGDEDDSWKSCFEAEGYDVECILEGLGQNEDIQQIYVSHTQDAIDSIAE